MMLSDNYRVKLLETLKTFSASINMTAKESYLTKKYTLHYPVIGSKYHSNKYLLLVGQATKGWCPEWIITQDDGDIESIITKSINKSMSISDNYPPREDGKSFFNSRKGSFFFNVTKKIMVDCFNLERNNWYEYITWSNIMKIAPKSKKNPNKIERRVQLDNVAKLFLTEIQELCPKNVIILTNLKGWARPILEANKIGINYPENSMKYVQAYATFNNSRIIVTKRPFFGVKYQDFVDEVAQFLVIN